MTSDNNLNRRSGRAITALIKSGRWLYDLLVAPRSIDEDRQRREFILNLILCAIIILLVWSEIFIIISFVREKAAENYVALEHFSLVCLFFMSLLIASRRGFVRIASYALVFALLAATVYGTSQWGASLPAGILAYALVITIAAIVISGRAGLVTTAVIVSVVAVFGRREIMSGVLPVWKHGLITPFDIVEYGLLFGAIAVVSWLSSREIEKSLSRARRSEVALRAERDSLERKVEERTAELKEAQAQKMSQLYRFAEFGRLSSGLFHDLASPLSAVVLNVNALNDEEHAGIKPLKEDVKRAMIASDRMASLLSAIRKQVRTDPTPLPFLINESIREVITLFKHRSLKMNVTLSYTAPEEITFVGSQTQLQQILTNLISNAFDSYEDTDTNETTSTTKQRMIKISLQRKEARIYLSVTDYGHGIAPDILQKIFEPFFSTKDASRGMGLGLAMAKSIIERDFGGTIHAESIPDKETVFSIELPA